MFVTELFYKCYVYPSPSDPLLKEDSKNKLSELSKKSFDILNPRNVLSYPLPEENSDKKFRQCLTVLINLCAETRSELRYGRTNDLLFKFLPELKDATLKFLEYVNAGENKDQIECAMGNLKLT